jgi:DNA-binding PadR family transcriptional regulator
MSLPKQQVVAYLLRIYDSDTGGFTFGRKISEDTGLLSGTVYPLLQQLVREGYLDSWWEDVDESAIGRRRRRFYRLNDEGAMWARQSLAAHSSSLAAAVRQVLFNGGTGARGVRNGPDDDLSTV